MDARDPWGTCYPSQPPATHLSIPALSLAALGVVSGDIGTNPLCKNAILALNQRDSGEMLEEMSRSRRLVAALGLCLAVAGIPALAAEHTFDGVYTGKRTLVKGTAGPLCPADDDVSVTIQGETLTFTNSALKKFAMSFYPGPDGSFGETYQGSDTVNIRGRIIGDVIEAEVTDYGSDPPCEHHWQLKKE
jgi:hypothetical protein